MNPRNRKKSPKLVRDISGDPADLPTIIAKVVGVPLEGEFQGFFQAAYKLEKDLRVEEVAVIYKGDLGSDKAPLVRINSACFTGDIFRDTSCDCNWQFVEAIRRINSQDGPGLVIYFFAHEGKGLGYYAKLLSYDGDMFPVRKDARDFTPAIAILRDLGVKRVKLMTNNPEKQAILSSYGIKVELVPIRPQNPNQRVQKLYDYKRSVFNHSI